MTPDLLEEELERLCEEIDRRDRELRSLVGTIDRERILSDTADLFRRFPLPDKRGPLFGATLGVKDIISVNGMETACGSALPARLFKAPEAHCINRLKRAGILIVGKTQTTEFACTDPGPTRNPLNTDHTPGGSSSGSAAAVSAGFCDFALGTQTIGSVIRPAAYCGVVGFKPTYDRVPIDGVFPFSKTVDTLGFFCAEVSRIFDFAPALLDCWGLQSNPVAIDRITLGVPHDAYLDQTDEIIRAAFESSLERLRDAGCHVKKTNVFEDIRELNRVHQQLIAGEMYRVHASYLDEYRGLYRPLTIATLDRGKEIDDATLANLIEQRRSNVIGHTRVMESNGVDFWLAPPTATLAPAGLESTGNPIMNLPFTHLGLPTVCLPAHAADNHLRHGLQIAAPWFRDEELAELAVQLAPVLRGE